MPRRPKYKVRQRLNSKGFDIDVRYNTGTKKPLIDGTLRLTNAFNKTMFAGKPSKNFLKITRK